MASPKWRDYAQVMAPSNAVAPNSETTLDHVVVTPENVVLTFQLAGPGSRLGAFLMDLLVRIGLFAIVSLVAVPFGLNLAALRFATLLVLYFLLDWLYFTLCEGFFRGQTRARRCLACG